MLLQLPTVFLIWFPFANTVSVIQQFTYFLNVYNVLSTILYFILFSMQMFSLSVMMMMMMMMMIVVMVMMMMLITMIITMKIIYKFINDKIHVR